MLQIKISFMKTEKVGQNSLISLLIHNYLLVISRLPFFS